MEYDGVIMEIIAKIIILIIFCLIGLLLGGCIKKPKPNPEDKREAIEYGVYGVILYLFIILVKFLCKNLRDDLM